MLILISNDLGSIICLIMKDAKSTVLTLNDESKFVVFPTNLELLSRIILESMDLELVVWTDSQTFVLIKNGDNLVGSIEFRLENSREIGMHLLNLNLNLASLLLVLLGQIVSRDYEPALVDTTMELPLADLSIRIGFTSLDIESLAL